MEPRKEDAPAKGGKLKYLAGNIALFSISNFVSKILVFLLVPLYTGVLTTYEYGIADILQVTMLLLVPALTVNMGEAALRFGIERSDKRGSILRCGLKYVLRADVLVAVLCLIGTVLVNDEIKWYLVLFIFLFAANSLYEYLVLFFQGSEKVPVVVIGSISSTLLMIVSNLIFLLVLKTGLSGYVFAQVIAYAAASAIMLIMGIRGDKTIDFKEDRELSDEMLKYGKPLLLYSTGSWVNNAADRYIVAGICGSAANGVYGVSYKIPAILMVFQRIFAQAWQMSATKSYKDENSDEFFSGMYRAYNAFMVIGCAGLILIVRLLALILFKKDFYEAWRMVPPLLISVIFGALTGFLGSICLAHKDSKSMGIATGIGAAVNVALNFASVPYFGAMGAAWATAISYFTMYFMAFMIVRRYVKITYNPVKDYAVYILLILESVIMILSLPYAYLICTCIVAAILAIYFREYKVLLGGMFEKMRRGK